MVLMLVFCPYDSYVPVCYWYVSRMDSYVPVRYWYVARMYSYVLVCTRMLLVCTRMYSCVTILTDDNTLTDYELGLFALYILSEILFIEHNEISI